MGVLVPASAQDETDPSGKLVAAPSSLAVGDSVEVVAFEVQPANLLVAFQYDEHLVLVGESCDDAATRTTVPIRAPVWIPLEACTAGEGHIRLLEAATDTVIAETTITIAEAGVGVSPQTEDEVIVQQQGCGQMFELPCPPPPDIDYTTSPSPPSANYSITVSWGVGGCDKYSVTGGLGNYEGSSTSKNYNRPCERSYNVSVQSYGDGVNYMEVWSFVSSRTVTTPGCPVTTPTPPPTNNPPAFSSASTSRSVPENTPSGRNIGSPVTATDQDGDSLTYSIGGTDASSFSIVTSTGQLRTSAALDYETKSSYSVTVTAEDPSDASDSITVTINVIDVDEGTDPVCSTPSPVRNLEVDAGDRRLDLGWDRPSDDGDCDIEYNVEYKLSSSSIWGSTDTVTKSSYSITGLANGTEHDVQVQACNDARCGDWSEESGTPQPPVPGQVPRPMLVPGDQKLDVSWDPPATNTTISTRYNVQYRLTSDTTWESGGTGISGLKRTISMLANDSEYEVRVRACNGSQCGEWSESATERAGVRYAKPRNLEVIPMPDRMARLTWDSSKNADNNTRYAVYAQAASSEEDDHIGTTIAARSTEYTLRLGRLADGKHLGEEEYFRIWVVANEKHDPEGTERVANSDRSDEIRIIDSPIISINGRIETPDPPVGTIVGTPPGQAAVEWDPPGDALRYTLRWRQLGDSGRHPHSSPEWRMNLDSLPSTFMAGHEKPIIDPRQVRSTIGDLDRGGLYAFQMNYVIEENGKEIQVFSARDRFVWTSEKAAGDGQRIATIPLTKRLSNGTFSYVFCDVPFPDSNNPTWEEFAEHAFKQWMFTTDNLITIEPDAGAECADYSEFVSEITPDLLAYVHDPQSDISTEAIESYILALVLNFDRAGYQSTRNMDLLLNEVVIVDNVDEPLMDAAVFDEVSRLVGHGICPDGSGGCAYLDEFEFSDGSVELTTDILLWHSTFRLGREPHTTYITPEWPDGFDGRRPQRDDVKFEACGGFDGTGVALMYSRLIHELGHALGILGGMDTTGEDIHHPYIVDSQMSNYIYRDLNFGCGPHPLDVMAMYALYQMEG